MNAQHEVDRLLEQAGAVLVRQKRHLVYRLPNGKNFVAAKTSSDLERAAKNSLSDLRRALGIVRQAPDPEGERVPIEENAAAAVAAPALPSFAPAAPPKGDSLKARIETAIARAESEQEVFLAAAQKTERRVQMLRALLPFAEEAASTDVLRAILDAAPAAVPKREPPPEPPQRIETRVQVTRQLVLAATQTFEGAFTVNDVLAVMTGGAAIDPKERQRVRSAIASTMFTLLDRGEVVRESAGIGKRQSVWRKAVLNGGGRDCGVGTRA